MTGPEHYAAAERLLSDASHSRTRAGGPLRKDGSPFEPGEHAALIARAQVHATLAQTAATAARLADRYVGDGDHINAWLAATGEDKSASAPTAQCCSRCADTDGPFVERGVDHIMCEPCGVWLDARVAGQRKGGA